MKSISGVGGECRRFNPTGPFTSSDWSPELVNALLDRAFGRENRLLGLLVDSRLLEELPGGSSGFARRCLRNNCQKSANRLDWGFRKAKGRRVNHCSPQT